MKKLVVLAVASLIATSANAAEMKWSGSADWRYTQLKQNDGLNSKFNNLDTSENKTKTHQVRANIGATGGWDNVEWGVGMRTGGAASANSDYQTVTGNLDRGVSLEQGWFRYLKDFGSLDLALTVGRQKNVIAYDSSSQNLYDNDVRWDGFGWNFKFGMFGMNAAQYITGARTAAEVGGVPVTGNDGASSYSQTEAQMKGRKFNYVLSFQPYMNWKFTDEIETMLAVGYHLWSDASNRNLSGGGVNNNWNTTTSTGAVPALASANVGVYNARQWQILNTWSLPMNLSVNIEYVRNKATPVDRLNTTNATTGAQYAGNVNPTLSRVSWAAGIKYGSIKKAHDFSVGYTYGNKGISAVIGNYSYDKWAPDNKGHMFNAAYAIADNFNIGIKALFLQEKERLDLGNASAALAGRAYGTANINQKLKSTNWELTTGVMF